MTEQEETLEMDETLEKITFYCFDEARQKLEQVGECVPFAVVVDGENMFVESHPGETAEECRASAQSQVKSASSFASHYAFCYDGFLDTDEGPLDALIVECASTDMDEAYAIGLIYREIDGAYEFEEMPAYIDSAELFFDRLAIEQAAREYTRDDLDEMLADMEDEEPED